MNIQRFEKLFLNYQIFFSYLGMLVYWLCVLWLTLLLLSGGNGITGIIIYLAIGFAISMVFWVPGLLLFKGYLNRRQGLNSNVTTSKKGLWTGTLLFNILPPLFAILYSITALLSDVTSYESWMYSLMMIGGTSLHFISCIGSAILLLKQKDS